MHQSHPEHEPVEAEKEPVISEAEVSRLVTSKLEEFEKFMDSDQKSDFVFASEPINQRTELALNQFYAALGAETPTSEERTARYSDSLHREGEGYSGRLISESTTRPGVELEEIRMSWPETEDVVTLSVRKNESAEDVDHSQAA